MEIGSLIKEAMGVTNAVVLTGPAKTLKSTTISLLLKTLSHLKDKEFDVKHINLNFFPKEILFRS